MGSDKDDTMLMSPRRFQQRIADNSNVDTIMVVAKDEASPKRFQGDLEGLVRERRGIVAGREDVFSVSDMTQIAETMSEKTTVLTGLLGALATINLLVGGIGIMNIITVSVARKLFCQALPIPVGLRAKKISKIIRRRVGMAANQATEGMSPAMRVELLPGNRTVTEATI